MNAVKYSVEVENLGQRIREARLGVTGITQRILAKAIGISQPHLNQIETGRINNTKADLLVKVADALDVDLRWLIMGHTHFTAPNLRAVPSPTPGHADEPPALPTDKGKRK